MFSSKVKRLIARPSFVCMQKFETLSESDEEDNADDDLYEDRRGNERMDDDDDEDEEENERDVTSGGIKGEGLDGTFKTDQVL